MLRYAVAIGPLLISTLAFGEGKDASYYCTAQLAAGIRYDVQSQKRKPDAFKDDDAFVLHLHYLGDKTVQRRPGDTSAAVYFERYSATITLQGSNTKAQCSDPDNKDALLGEINILSFDGRRLDFVFCNAISNGGWSDEGVYRFNFVNNRFTHVSNITVGFLTESGDDGKEPSTKIGPYVVAGTCTLIQ